MNSIMENRKASHVTKIGVYSLLLSSGLGLDLNDFFYSSEWRETLFLFTVCTDKILYFCLIMKLLL